ncbi:helix-turn-helix transcriptional regulator [Bradyrhizobium sp. Arg68]|uniref:helix-turn-helix domain-containing protein n=1 Tax=Bradyrhizobium ivorense TaxID=2511166 RepID=UPI001E299E20|nr:AraC family transcriptional regulator [Bradyrhizobium ivorense]MCC8935688.1 helix-turn-helix transcriptional regulator [Bradyrhizobium ivorense]
MPRRRGNQPAARTPLDDRRLRRVMQFIAANLQNRIRLKDLAAVANLSPFHFARSFRKATGETPYRFVRECRLERSKQLLAQNDAALAEISLRCHFSSQSSFTRAFKRAFGQSPGRYRDEHGARPKK